MTALPFADSWYYLSAERNSAQKIVTSVKSYQPNTHDMRSNYYLSTDRPSIIYLLYIECQRKEVLYASTVTRCCAQVCSRVMSYLRFHASVHWQASGASSWWVLHRRERRYCQKASFKLKQSTHIPHLRTVYWEISRDYSPLLYSLFLNSLLYNFSSLSNNIADAPMEVAAAIEALLPASSPPSTVFPEVEVFILLFEHYWTKFERIN